MVRDVVVKAGVVMLAIVFVAVGRMFWWESKGILLAVAGLIAAVGYLYGTFGDGEGFRTQRPVLDLITLLAAGVIAAASLLFAFFEVSGGDVPLLLLVPYSIGMGALGVSVFVREVGSSPG